MYINWPKPTGLSVHSTALHLWQIYQYLKFLASRYENFSSLYKDNLKSDSTRNNAHILETSVQDYHILAHSQLYRFSCHCWQTESINDNMVVSCKKTSPVILTSQESKNPNKNLKGRILISILNDSTVSTISNMILTTFK